MNYCNSTPGLGKNSDGAGCYIVVNLLSGEFYVGFSSQSPLKRLRAHFQLSNNINLNNVLANLGPKHFAYAVWNKSRDVQGTPAFYAALIEALLLRIHQNKGILYSQSASGKVHTYKYAAIIGLEGSGKVLSVEHSNKWIRNVAE